MTWKAGMAGRIREMWNRYGAGKANRPPDVEGLGRFVRTPDRDEARFFVGRKSEIEHVRALFETFERESPTSVTTLFQGAAGAGKSAILKEIGKIARLYDHVEFAEVLGVDMNSEQGLAAKIAMCLNGKLRGRMRETVVHGTTSMRGGRINVEAVSGEAGTEGRRESSTGPLPATLAALGDEVRRTRGNKTLCLCVDEIQKVRPGSDAEGILLSLHAGNAGMKVIPIYAGLANSKEVLERVGLYRTATRHTFTVGRLVPPEVDELVDRFFDRFRVDCQDAHGEGWKRWIKDESACWPQHLHSCLTSLADELSRNAGVLADVDRDIVKSRTAQKKLEFYRELRGRRLSRCRSLVSATMQAVKGVREGACTREAVLGWIEANASNETGSRIPDGMGPCEFLDLLTEKGVLVENREKRFQCPIPTYGEYLIRDGRKTTAIQREIESGNREEARKKAIQKILDTDPAEAVKEDDRGRNAFHEAAESGQRGILKMLLELPDAGEGAAAARPDEGGVTPLHGACLNGHFDLARDIMAKTGFTKARRVHDGNSVLHDAVLSGCLETVSTVLAFCKDPDLKNHAGETPRDLAAKRGFGSAERLLAET